MLSKPLLFYSQLPSPASAGRPVTLGFAVSHGSQLRSPMEDPYCSCKLTRVRSTVKAPGTDTLRLMVPAPAAAAAPVGGGGGGGRSSTRSSMKSSIGSVRTPPFALWFHCLRGKDTAFA